MANSKIDNQMERMHFLMEYKTTPKVDAKAGIEYTINTADGKTYGIIRENNMYYIKTTTPDKAKIKESYEYLNGYNYRRENGYKSFNEASKHLELMIMGINESCGKHEDVSILLNPNKGKEDMRSLTESARTELDRMHQIFENSGNIGHYKNPFTDKEGKGTASAENTEKNNAPFEKKSEATLDKDPKFNGTVDGATPDNKEVAEGAVDSDLQSDKMKSANSGSQKDFKNTKSDLDSSKELPSDKPSGAKAVKMNESFYDFDGFDDFVGDDDNDYDDKLKNFKLPDDFVEYKPKKTTKPKKSGLAGFDDEDDIEPSDFDDEEDIELSDFDDEEDNDLDEVLKEFLDPSFNIGSNNSIASGNETNSDLSAIPMEEDVRDGDETTINGKDKGKKVSAIIGSEEALDGTRGSLDAQACDVLQESINRITNSIYNRLCEGRKTKSKKVRLQESIDRIVAEEVRKLDVWGKHPRYQKPAFKTPDNKEVNVNGSEDWNDDSARGSEAYGKKVGSGDPFNVSVDMLTDAVFKTIKEGDLKKKVK